MTAGVAAMMRRKVHGMNVTEELKKTPLHALHISMGGKMVGFAGYDMPVQYADGVLKEHLHTREKAGLFDVSHMGQAVIVGPDYRTTAAALETLVPGEIQKLGISRQRYTVLTNDDGGILDDLIVSRPVTDGRLNIVVNAACKDKDYAWIEARLPDGITLEKFENRALIALQGPKAVDVLSAMAPEAAALKFMTFAEMKLGEVTAVVSRSGYTGEDGFEISVWEKDAMVMAEYLLASPDVEPIGLGARDSLRLEAGLCLYGHDLDETTSPVEGNINFAIGKRRKQEGGFPGASRILNELVNGTERLRVGIKSEGRAPAREGVEVQDTDGNKIGIVTSGGFGPTAEGPVAMGYVAASAAVTDTMVNLIVRGKAQPAKIVDMPYVAHKYFRG